MWLDLDLPAAFGTQGLDNDGPEAAYNQVNAAFGFAIAVPTA
jgi:hypothetical protein